MCVCLCISLCVLVCVCKYTPALEGYQHLAQSPTRLPFPSALSPLSFFSSFHWRRFYVPHPRFQSAYLEDRPPPLSLCCPAAVTETLSFSSLARSLSVSPSPVPCLCPRRSVCRLSAWCVSAAAMDGHEEEAEHRGPFQADGQQQQQQTIFYVEGQVRPGVARTWSACVCMCMRVCAEERRQQGERQRREREKRQR